MSCVQPQGHIGNGTYFIGDSHGGAEGLASGQKVASLALFASPGDLRMALRRLCYKFGVQDLEVVQFHHGARDGEGSTGPERILKVVGVVDVCVVWCDICHESCQKMDTTSPWL